MYKINVSKNGIHCFATDENTIGDYNHIVILYKQFMKLFPKEKGYKIDVMQIDKRYYDITDKIKGADK